MDLVTLTSGPVVSGNLVSKQHAGTVAGVIVGVYVEPVMGCASGVPTITITSELGGETILEVDTDEAGWYFVTRQLNSSTDGALIANQYARGIPVFGKVTVSIDNAEIGDYVNVSLLVE